MGASVFTLIYLPYALMALLFFNRYMVGSFVRLKPVPARAVGDWPPVTITIPCFNEGRTIYRTVRSLASMDYPTDRLTIHVVDDASGEETRRALEDALADTPNLNVTFQPRNRGKRLNLIDAVRSAETDLVLSVDSDCIVEADTLKELVRHLEDDIVAVGGVVRVINPDVNFLTRLQEVKYYIGYEFLKGLENQFKKIMCLSGCLTLYRRHVLLEVEHDLLKRNLLGQDVKYGEDRYLTRKIVERGYNTRLCQTAICYTKVPETFANWFSQQLRWRRSNLVDFLGGWFRAHRLPLPVALHYTTLGSLLFLYPLAVLTSILSGEILLPIVVHGVFIVLLAGLYLVRSRTARGLHGVNVLPSLALPIVFATSYLILTPLALLSLVTVQWETRSAEPNQS